METRNPKTVIAELRLQDEPTPPAPPAPPAPAPPEPPAEPAQPIVVEKFSADECVAGAMEEGETFGTMEIEPGVMGVTCRRSAEAEPEVQALQFDPTTFDETTAAAYAESAEFQAWNRGFARRLVALSLKPGRFNVAAFQEAGELVPGSPEDPEAPKLSEGMESYRQAILEAIDAKGWSFFGSLEPEYDFIIEELWPDRVLVIDTISGKYYSILVAKLEDGTVQLGDPTEVDITVSVPEDALEVPPPVAASSRSSVKPLRFAAQGAIVERRDGQAGATCPTYRVLLCQSGWTKDRRFLTDDCVREAVDSARFDGAKCYYGHPEPNTGGKRTRLAVGFVKPGTVQLETNPAGRLNVWGDIALMRSTGGAIQEFLDQSLEIGVPLLGNSIYSREAEMYEGEIEGREAQVFTKLLSEKVSVDFVEDPAFPAAGAKTKLAADADEGAEGDQLTMKERERLETLEAENKQLKADAARDKKRTELAAVVDAELSATGWPKEFVAVQRPILLEIESASVRKSQIATMNMLLGRKAPAASTGSGPTDGGVFNPGVLSAETRASIEAIAKSRGYKADAIENAEKTAFSRR